MGNVIRRIATAVMMVVMFVFINVNYVKAEEIIAQGNCGAAGNEANVIWELTSDGVLTLSGEGEFNTGLYSNDKGMCLFRTYDSDVPIYTKSITRIIIDEGITTISENAFSGFANLQEVILPDTINEIGDGAFRECSKLESIIIPKNVKRIGWLAFLQCKRLDNVVFNGNGYIIDERAFSECIKLSKIDLSGAKEIKSGAFSYCGELEEAIIPDGISKIEGFDCCEKLTTIKIPDTVTEIGYNAFAGCSSLKNINIPDSVTIIGDNAFWGCKSFDFVLPKNLKTIGGNAFVECGSVKNVVLPESIETLGPGAFSVERLVLPKNLKEIPDNAFNDEIIIYCTNNDQVEYCEEYSRCRYIDTTQIHNIVNTTFENISNSVLHTGEAIIPDIKLIYENDGKEIELKEDFDYKVEYYNNVAPGIAKLQLRGINYWSGEREGEFEIYAQIESCEIKLSNDKVLYDGYEKRPKETVKYGDLTLDNGIDYDVTYSDNIEEGIASVKITGKGNYKGEVVKEFTIYKNVITDKDCALEYSEVLFDASAKKPNVTVKYEGNDLVLGKDYKVDYANNTDVGEATVTITGMGSYKGTVTKSFSIYKYDLSKANVSLSYEDVLYDGMAKVPEITVTYDGKTLTKDKDYSVEIINNTLPGTATVRGTGVGQYSGTVEKIFTITALSIEKADVALKESIYSYDGSPKTPSVDVKLGEKMLVKDTDYILTYENNIDDGTAHAVVTGTGIYKDVIKVSFVILPYNAGMDAVYPEGTLIDDDYVYGVTDDETNEVEFFCPANQKLKSVHIPATVTDENGTVYTVTSIGNKAFYKNTQITSVVIANTVKSIEDYAFYGCKNIKTLKIGSGVEVIGNSAFRKCTKLTAVTLPKSIDSLGKNCFYGCSKLKTITINANSVVDVKANAIKGVSKKCVIKVPKKLVKKYQKEFDKKSGFTSGMKVKKK